MKESNLILYSLPEGFVKVEVVFEEESFWLNQKRMADLFQVDVRTINEHLKNIFESGELQQDSTIRKFRIVHIAELNRIISAYLDLAENRAVRQIVMTMNDWIVFLHNFLNLSNYPILQHLGQISAMEAKIKAETEFDKYRVIQDQNYVSDFDKLVTQLKKGEENE